MTLTEQVKILDDKIKANKAQYDLDREARFTIKTRHNSKNKIRIFSIRRSF